MALQSLFAECNPDADTQYVVHLFTQDTIANYLREHKDFQATVSSCHAICREKIIADAVEPLCNQRTLTLIKDVSSAASTQKHAFQLAAFLVPKHDAVSSRLIIDCRPINTLLCQFPLPRMPLPRVEDIIEAGLKRSFMTTRDASSMFYQFGLLSLSLTSCKFELPTDVENSRRQGLMYFQWGSRLHHPWLSISLITFAA